jgi:hypothetical protein
MYSMHEAGALGKAQFGGAPLSIVTLQVDQKLVPFSAVIGAN